MQPTIGRIVHYRSELYRPNNTITVGETWAAIVTRVNANGSIDLVAFPPGDNIVHVHAVCQVEWNQDQEPNTWCWPPRD